MPKTAINRREFLQLAKKYRPGRDEIGGWFVSEKLDGTRCFWDGGLTRGLRTEHIPWASVTDPKTGKRKLKLKPVATGLWSRYGNPIIAPDDFLDLLPAFPLDGELWAGRGNFQLCRSICGGDTPDPRFNQIQFAAYGCPPINRVVASGEIKNANFHATFDPDEMVNFIVACIKTNCSKFQTLEDDATFEEELLNLSEMLDGDRVFMHRQVRLPVDQDAACLTVENELNRVIENGGEGVVIRDPFAQWTPKRVSSLLKYKPFNDAEGTLVGFTAGRETDKGSKHLGKIGALILDYKGKRLELSGLTDEEREFATNSMKEHAEENPGKDMPRGIGIEGKHFKIGQQITFIYRDLSDDGIPKEARYFRQREDEE
jgi:DNA ligase-1